MGAVQQTVHSCHLVAVGRNSMDLVTTRSDLMLAAAGGGWGYVEEAGGVRMAEGVMGSEE